jgi:hypothetical protein
MDSYEEEWSALEYARHHGLCKPYNDGVTYDGSLPAFTNNTFDLDLSDPSEDSVTNSVTALIRERLAVSRDAALLLKSIHELQDALPAEVTITERHRWMLDLKQELPLLRTDNELDLLSFGNAAMPDLSHANIPFEVVHEDNDEGFDWPMKYTTYTAAQCEEQIRAEKLVVSKEVLLHLQDAIRDSFTSHDIGTIEDESLRYRSVGDAPTPSDITKNVETCLSTNYTTSASTITAVGSLHTIVSREPPPTSVR